MVTESGPRTAHGGRFADECQRQGGRGGVRQTRPLTGAFFAGAEEICREDRDRGSKKARRGEGGRSANGLGGPGRKCGLSQRRSRALCDGVLQRPGSGGAPPHTPGQSAAGLWRPTLLRGLVLVARANHDEEHPRLLASPYYVHTLAAGHPSQLRRLL